MVQIHHFRNTLPYWQGKHFWAYISNFEQYVLFRLINYMSIITAWKVSKYGVITGPYFLVFGLNTEIYRVNLRIQSGYRKIRTRKNSVFGHFSLSIIIRISSVRQKYVGLILGTAVLKVRTFHMRLFGGF